MILVINFNIITFATMDKIKPEDILNEDEMRASKDAFDAYDKMGYGTLEVEELQKVLEGMYYIMEYV